MVIVWRPHGMTRPIFHLTYEWQRDPRLPPRHDPLCGAASTSDTVQRPDGFEYCRACIAREGNREK